jgi:hypothetical protein
MSNTNATETLNEVKGKLALSEAENHSQLSDPIPKWLERASVILMLLGLAMAYFPDVKVRVPVVCMFVSLSLHWNVTGKLRRKVEAMSEIIQNYEKKELEKSV